jgi:hypothetical protein
MSYFLRDQAYSEGMIGEFLHDNVAGTLPAAHT